MILKEYTDAFGTSGCEKEIRELITSKVEGFGETGRVHSHFLFLINTNIPPNINRVGNIYFVISALI
jgi:hypothetical protein